jgi:hypothetical protein
MAVAVGLVTALGAFAMATTPVRLEPGTRVWRRCVAGASADGTLLGGTVVVVPGVDRGVPRRMRVEIQGGPANVGVTIDRAQQVWLRADGSAAHVVVLPATRVPGVRLDLRVDPPGAPLRLRAVAIVPERPSPSSGVVMLGWAALIGTVVLSWRASARLALAVALAGAAFLIAATTPLMLLWSLPAAPALARVAVPLALLAAAIVVGRASGEPRRFAFAAALLLAAVFGAWVRAYFLPSAGSWDVDYWKACALHTRAQGVTHAYGGPDAVPPGHFLAQLRGEEPAWELPAFGRTFVIDQPPGIQLLWKTSWQLLSATSTMTGDEALNAAAKLPAVLGDVFAVGVLLCAFGATRRGLVLAALYWALPISWLSSAVLGFFDGAYVPLAVAALYSAGRGRAVRAGLLIALAALVKSLALLVAPAIVVALWRARAPIRKAVAAGAIVALIALVPFVAYGTLGTAIIHMYRILFQLRLSGGYGNTWWLLGHVLTLGSRAWSDAIPYVRIETVAVPVRPIGTLLFALIAAWVVRCQLRAPGPRAAVLAGAVLVLAYGQVAIGIHENHPHAFVLALVATGLATRRLRALAAVFLTTYVLNMLALSGLGRFYTLRYVAIDALAKSAAGVRMGLGFDLTLALAILNVAAFAVLLVSLRSEMEAAADQAGSTRSPDSQEAPAASSSAATATSTGGNSSR